MKLSQDSWIGLDVDRAFQRWDKKYCDWLKTRPVCDKCQEPIIDSDCYMDADATVFCNNCAEDIDRLFKIQID